MKRLLFVLAAVVTTAGWFVRWWRQHPRAGAATVNRLVNPWLVSKGVADLSGGEIGLIEHIGRKSGTVRLTPVHPVRTGAGFRFIVPLGAASQWARNVLATGHCRLQVGEVIHELDEPRLVSPIEVEAIPRAAAGVMDWLGFRYLLLRRFAEQPGVLVVPSSGAGDLRVAEGPSVADASPGVETTAPEPTAEPARVETLPETPDLVPTS
jgi:deazaflavin-dependent oxidoreductase (nitroreductase family)